MASPASSGGSESTGPMGSVGSGSPAGSRLECPVCLEGLDGSGRRPLCLPCGHSVCAACAPLLNLCPVCRAFAPVPATVTNYALLDLVRQRQPPPPPTAQPSPPPASTKPGTCGDCGVGLSPAAAWLCETEGRLVCPACGLRVHRAHSLRLASEVAEERARALHALAAGMAELLNGEALLYKRVVEGASPAAAFTALLAGRDPLEEAKAGLRRLLDDCLNKALPRPQLSAKPSPASASAARVYVGNLPYTAGPEEISEWLGRAGGCRVLGVRIPQDKGLGRAKGIAFVQMADQRSFDRAIALDGTTYGGRKIKVAVAEHPSRAGLQGDVAVAPHTLPSLLPSPRRPSA